MADVSWSLVIFIATIQRSLGIHFIEHVACLEVFIKYVKSDTGLLVGFLLRVAQFAVERLPEEETSEGV